MTVFPVPMAEVRRGPFVESRHRGHAVICGPDGDVIESWGDPGAVMLPRSSAKMIQALPLVASGAADAQGLGSRQLALACASHQGAPVHVDAVRAWLSALGMTDADLRCGPEPSRDPTLAEQMLRQNLAPCQVHNNCSGKHCGFLTLNAQLGGGPEYHEPGHPVQIACREAFETVTGVPSPGYGLDGCSAPNFATTLHGLARAMAYFAVARDGDPDRLGRAAARLTTAMHTHPEMVAGEGRACTRLMRAAREPLALKTGAEGVFVAILPARGLGLALKIEDGATRASECAVAALLVRLGVIDPQDPAVRDFLEPEIRNRRGLVTGQIRPAPDLLH